MTLFWDMPFVGGPADGTVLRVEAGPDGFPPSRRIAVPVPDSRTDYHNEYYYASHLFRGREWGFEGPQAAGWAYVPENESWRHISEAMKRMVFCPAVSS